MKTLKSKALIVASGVAMFAVIGLSPPAFSGTPASPDKTSKFLKENDIIREDIAAIRFYKQHINQLQEKYKKDKADGREEAMILDKRDLMKAQADLGRHQDYLAADKRVLVKNHQLAIRNARDEIKKDRSELKACRNRLDQDISVGNEAALTADASKVIQSQNELKNDQSRLSKERSSLDSDLAAVDREIQKVNGFSVTAYSETAYSNFNNALNK